MLMARKNKKDFVLKKINPKYCWYGYGIKRGRHFIVGDQDLDTTLMTQIDKQRILLRLTI